MVIVLINKRACSGFEVDPGSLNFGSHYAGEAPVIGLALNVINTGSTDIDWSMHCGPNPFTGGGGGTLGAGKTANGYAQLSLDTVGSFSGSCTVTGTSPATRERMTRTVALSGTVLVPKPPPPVKK